MKKVLFSGGLLALGALAFCAFTWSKVQQLPAPGKKVKWHTWEEAMAANEKQPKKIFIDVYTDWCGWCKKMDTSTFEDDKVAAYLNERFYAVKLNAEQKEEIVYDGHTFKYIEGQPRGVHEFAYALLDGRLGYPAFVYLDEEQRRISISPGYKTAEVMLRELQYIGENKYMKGAAKDSNGK